MRQNAENTSTGGYVVLFQVVSKYDSDGSGASVKRYMSEMKEINTTLTENMPTVQAARLSVIGKCNCFLQN